MEVVVAPANDRSQANLELDWNIVEFTEDYVEIQVNFEDPESISTDEVNLD